MMDVSITRLVWKDVLLVRSLLYLATIVVIIGNLAWAISYHQSSVEMKPSLRLLVTLWVSVPFLVAFGTPALLVGTERESGTLAWLRTLPIARSKVIYSKLLVGLFSLMLTWVLSTVAVLVVKFGIVPIGQYEWWFHTFVWFHPLPLLLSGVLLITGFVMSYVFKSPIASLVATILASLTVFFVSGVGTELLYHYFLDSHDTTREHKGLILTLFSIGDVVLLLAVHHMFAVRRLRPAIGPNRQSSSEFSLTEMARFSTATDDSVYRLNIQLQLPKFRLPKLNLRSATTKQPFFTRPTPAYALLWQAASQQAVSVIVIATWNILLWMYIATWASRDPLGQILHVTATISMFLSTPYLGSLVFYPDSLQRRHLFFWERGLSRTLVWCTRFAMPAAAFVAVAFAFLLVDHDKWNLGLSLFSMFPMLASGALTSMVAVRPTLGLIAGPVLGVVVAMLTFPALEVYFRNGYLPAISLASIPTLFATWRLLPRWSMGQRGIGFNERVAGYIMLGVLFVYVYVFGHRILSTPAALPEWRAGLLAQPFTFRAKESFDYFGDYAEVRQSFRLSVGAGTVDSKVNAATKMLERTRMAREAILSGSLESSLWDEVEADEAEALKMLSDLRDGSLGNKNLLPALQSLASDSLRRQSRKVAMTNEWKKYQEGLWIDDRIPGSSYTPKVLFGNSTSAAQMNYSFERLRTDRFVDAATKATLEYLDGNSSQASDSQAKQLRWLWANAFGWNIQNDRWSPADAIESDSLVADFRAMMDASNQLETIP